MPTVIEVLSTTGTHTWVAPADLNSTVQIECIGGGVGGTGFHNPILSKAGAGGAYAKTNAASITPGGSYSYNVAAGYISPNGINQGQGGDSWFGNASISQPTCLCLAQGGSGTVGGSTGGSKGDVVKAGGAGHVTVLGDPWGGGGAGGPNANGQDGSTTKGGDGDGSGGDGIGGNCGSSGLPGGDGNNLAGGAAGSGGGGGGSSVGNGAPGGAYGAGGGEGFGAFGGDPGQGVVILTYTTPDAPVGSSQGYIF